MHLGRDRFIVVVTKNSRSNLYLVGGASQTREVLLARLVGSGARAHWATRPREREKNTIEIRLVSAT